MGSNPFQGKGQICSTSWVLGAVAEQVLFSEFLGYGVKFMFFFLAIKLARGTRFSLAPCS